MFHRHAIRSALPLDLVTVTDRGLILFGAAFAAQSGITAGDFIALWFDVDTKQIGIERLTKHEAGCAKVCQQTRGLVLSAVSFCRKHNIQAGRYSATFDPGRGLYICERLETREAIA